MVRSPYTAVEHYLEQLRALTEIGLLNEISDGEFRFTAKGREWTNKLIRDVRNVMSEVDPLSKNDGVKLSELLQKMVESCLNNPPPPDTWSIQLSHKLMPEKEPSLPLIEQAFSCLAAYRDDSHLAAWQQSGLSATSLETLTLIWSERVHSLNEIVDLLSHRGHPYQVYVDALKELLSNKLIEGSIDDLKLSSVGKSFRDKVEEDTDRFFFAPWSCLTESDRKELEFLLNKLRGGLLSV
ncbi:MAG: helix-turn-helix domain-containing protein [Anaerolineales bacterium]